MQHLETSYFIHDCNRECQSVSIILIRPPRLKCHRGTRSARYGNLDSGLRCVRYAAEAAAPRTAHAARVAPHAAAALGKRCECFQTIARGDSSTIVIRRVATASSRNCVNAALLEAIPSSRPLLALFEEVPLKAFAMEHAAGALLEPKFQALG
ncbi:unnamed protein product [Lampetra planeri]